MVLRPSYFRWFLNIAHKWWSIFSGCHCVWVVFTVVEVGSPRCYRVLVRPRYPSSQRSSRGPRITHVPAAVYVFQTRSIHLAFFFWSPDVVQHSFSLSKMLFQAIRRCTFIVSFKSVFYSIAAESYGIDLDVFCGNPFFVNIFFSRNQMELPAE